MCLINTAVLEILEESKKQLKKANYEEMWQIGGKPRIADDLLYI